MKGHEINEQVIVEALRLREEGKTSAEIFARFPNDRSELEGIFSTIEFLSANRDFVPHERGVLRTAIEKAPVTLDASKRYGESRGVPGRPSIHEKETLTSIMNKWKVMIPVGVVALLLIVFAAANTGSHNLSLTLQQEAAKVNVDTLDSSLGIESATNDVVGTDADDADAESTDFTKFEQEMKQESKSVELGNDFDSFFAEEQAIDEEVANTNS